MMGHVQSVGVEKISVQLMVDEKLFGQAQILGMDLSQILESRLMELVDRERIAKWKEENRQAIKEYNDRIDRVGAFGDYAKVF